LAFEFSASPELEEGVSRFDLCWLYAYITGQRTIREPELNWTTEPPNAGMYQLYWLVLGSWPVLGPVRGLILVQLDNLYWVQFYVIGHSLRVLAFGFGLLTSSATLLANFWVLHQLLVRFLCNWRFCGYSIAILACFGFWSSSQSGFGFWSSSQSGCV